MGPIVGAAGSGRGEVVCVAVADAKAFKVADVFDICQRRIEVAQNVLHGGHARDNAIVLCDIFVNRRRAGCAFGIYQATGCFWSKLTAINSNEIGARCCILSKISNMP
jgi:hypothetical protein